MITNRSIPLIANAIIAFISATILLVESPRTGKGEVIAVRFLELKVEVDTTEFEKFIREEYNPAYEGTIPGLNEFIAKSDRGTNVNSYALFMVFDSQIIRDLMIPNEGKMEEWISKIIKDQQLWPVWNKLKTYLVDGSWKKYNDFVVLR